LNKTLLILHGAKNKQFKKKKKKKEIIAFSAFLDLLGDLGQMSHLISSPCSE
jgi:hypothetical protein